MMENLETINSPTAKSLEAKLEKFGVLKELEPFNDLVIKTGQFPPNLDYELMREDVSIHDQNADIYQSKMDPRNPGLRKIYIHLRKRNSL